MMELWFTQSFELLRCFIESSVIDCSATRTSQGEISEVDPLQMSKFPILREEKRPRGFGSHICDEKTTAVMLFWLQMVRALSAQLTKMPTVSLV
jgi:hypothetical protein